MAQGIPGAVGYQPDCLTCSDSGYSDSCLGHKLCPAKCQAGLKAAAEIGDASYRSVGHVFLTENQKLEDIEQDASYRSHAGHIIKDGAGGLMSVYREQIAGERA
jgi:hypothetical protein